jgi:hypothetical protein
VNVFLMGEPRFGQQGTLTRVRAQTGTRSAAVKQTKYERVYFYAAAEPASGDCVALLAPAVNTETFNVFLRTASENPAKESDQCAARADSSSCPYHTTCSGDSQSAADADAALGGG